MVKIGLDISYNSTGLCIISDDAKPVFYQICPSEEKHSCSTHFDTYHREYSDTGDFSTNEINRVKDAESLAIKLTQIIRKYVPKSKEVEIRIEAPMNMAFVRRSMKYHNGNDMVVINKIVTLYMLKMQNATVKCIPVTKIKKAFTGKGNGKKEHMISTFFEKHFPDFDDTGKIDDIIDAYALAYCDF